MGRKTNFKKKVVVTRYGVVGRGYMQNGQQVVFVNKNGCLPSRRVRATPLKTVPVATGLCDGLSIIEKW